MSHEAFVSTELQLLSSAMCSCVYPNNTGKSVGEICTEMGHTLGIATDRLEDLVPIIVSALSDLCKSFAVIIESSC